MLAIKPFNGTTEVLQGLTLGEKTRLISIFWCRECKQCYRVGPSGEQHVERNPTLCRSDPLSAGTLNRESPSHPASYSEAAEINSGGFFSPFKNLLINLTPSKRLQARQPAICKAATEATSEVCLRGSADMNRSSLGELYPAAASCCCLSFAKQQASDNRSSACVRKDFSDGGKRFTLLMIPGAESSSL